MQIGNNAVGQANDSKCDPKSIPNKNPSVRHTPEAQERVLGTLEANPSDPGKKPANKWMPKPELVHKVQDARHEQVEEKQWS